MKCSYCGGERIELGVAWGKATQTGNLGLKYRVGGSGVFALTGVAQVYSDLCLDCGSVLRTYVKETTNKEWSHAPGSLGSK